MKHIVFDLGAVLIQWDPVHAFSDHFDDHASTRDWLDQIGFHDWNRSQDGGRSIADGLAIAHETHGDLADPLQSYTGRFADTITEPVPGAWEIAEDLKASGHRLFAITNWSADNWPPAIQLYPRLTTIFEDIVISGVEGMLKPDAAIYQRLFDRNGIDPRDCIFIDDSKANVEGARAVGMDAIHFTTAPALRDELKQRGIG